jgi:hypothetical protein
MNFQLDILEKNARINVSKRKIHLNLEIKSKNDKKIGNLKKLKNFKVIF